MAIAVADSVQVDGTGSYTAAAASSRILVRGFGASRGGAGAPTTTGCTFGGVPMTLAVSAVNTLQRFQLSALYFLLEADIPSGSQAFAQSFGPNTPDSVIKGFAWTLSGAAQSAPVIDSGIGDAVTTLSGSGLAVTTGGIVIASIGKSEDADDVSTPAGYTKGFITPPGTFDFSGRQDFFHKTISSDGTETPAFTFGSANASLGLLFFAQAAAAGASLSWLKA